VPFHFNNQFSNSLKVAAEIAKRSNAKITILSVISTSEVVVSDFVVNCVLPANESVSSVDEREMAIFKYLTDERISDSLVEVKVGLGGFKENIELLHRREEFDLIIVPDFSKTVYERLFADINPLQLMNDAKTAVIGVNKKLRLFSIKKIILPIRNVKNWYDKIPFTSALAKITGVQVVILGTADSKSTEVTKCIEQKIELCMKHFKINGIGFLVERIYGRDDPARDIALYSKYKRADLIVVSPQIHNPLVDTFFNTNLYNKLITKCNIPVMGVTLT